MNKLSSISNYRPKLSKELAFQVPLVLLSLIAVFLFLHSCDLEDKPIKLLELISVRIGTDNLEIEASSHSFGVPIDQPIIATFAEPLDRSSVEKSFRLVQDRDTLALTFSYLDEDKTVSFKPSGKLSNKKFYQLFIRKGLRGATGSEFPGIGLGFETKPGILSIQSFTINGVNAQGTQLLQGLPINFQAEVVFSAPVATEAIAAQPVTLTQPGGSVPLQVTWSDQNTKLTVIASAPLKDLTRCGLVFSSAIIGSQGELFQPFTRVFYTQLDTQPKLPLLADEDLLTEVQHQTFKYFWDFAHPASGMARERNTSADLVTSGGSGFGIMALIVGIERGFITRQQGIERMNKIVGFLETADRFHGVWPHWMNGNTGDVIPFSTKDNGGDLVETSFLVQGLITFRQYLNPNDPQEKTLIDRINVLWEGVEWSWYRKNNENVLYWHWSPTYNWEMNFALYGYFEQQITYVLAAASPTYSIPKEVYTNGFGRNGAIKTGNVYYGITLPLATPSPLFWVHYSYLGLDPHFSDEYANYWEQNVNASLINQAHCIANPKQFVGYSDQCWGLTSSDSPGGYAAHSPGNDLGVITPTAALSSFPYTPEASMKALKFFYYNLGDRLWGPYGFYDAFSITHGWYADSYLAIDQGPIIIMIENYRTQLLWNLFMSAPEVHAAKAKLGFN